MGTAGKGVGYIVAAIDASLFYIVWTVGYTFYLSPPTLIGAIDFIPIVLYFLFFVIVGALVGMFPLGAQLSGRLGDLTFLVLFTSVGQAQFPPLQLAASLCPCCQILN